MRVLDNMESFSSILFAYGLVSRDLVNIFTNEAKLNWYMLFILIKSPNAMKRFDPMWAKFRYTFLCWSKDWPRFLDSFNAFSICLLWTLVWLRFSMSCLLSKMFPYELPSSNSNCFSKPANWIWSLSSSSRSYVFLLSSSGCSKLIVIERSWPSRPLFVTVKFTFVTKA